jgi:uncharacterized protein (TIGR02466 family)
MVHYLFPTPVYVANAESPFTKENEQLDKFDITAKGFNEYGEKSVNTYILDDFRLSELSRWIVQQINLYSTQELFKGTNAKDYVLLQSWISIKYPGQAHAAHIHPNSVISGIYYWEPVVQPITFVNSKPVEIGPTQLNDYTFTLPNIQPGTLVLFPSNLKHTVAVNNTDTPRKSLAFNSIPTTGFGSRGQLTEIDLERLKHKLIGR